MQVGIVTVLDVLRPTPLILALVDKPLQLLRWPFRLVQVHGLEYPADQSLLVLRIQDLEALWQPCLLPVPTQQTMRQPMKGAHPHAGCRRFDQLFDAFTHLAGSLVGEGHGKNGVWGQTLDIDQPGDTMHQHAGLAATGTGQHHQRIWRRAHGLTLGVIERVDNAGDIHGQRL